MTISPLQVKSIDTKEGNDQAILGGCQIER